MTISLKLNPSLFDAGNYFHGIPKNRAVLAIGTGRNDVYTGKINTMPATNPSFRGNQLTFMIDTRGSEVSDYMFEYIMQNGGYQVYYASHILDMAERGLIQVFHDGSLLTTAQIQAFTAP